MSTVTSRVWTHRIFISRKNKYRYVKQEKKKLTTVTCGWILEHNIFNSLKCSFRLSVVSFHFISRPTRVFSILYTVLLFCHFCYCFVARLQLQCSAYKIPGNFFPSTLPFISPFFFFSLSVPFQFYSCLLYCLLLVLYVVWQVFCLAPFLSLVFIH